MTYIRAQTIPITKSSEFTGADAFLYAEIDLAVPAISKKKVFITLHRVVPSRILILFRNSVGMDVSNVSTGWVGISSSLREDDEAIGWPWNIGAMDVDLMTTDDVS